MMIGTHDDPTASAAGLLSPPYFATSDYSPSAFAAALQGYLPSNFDSPYTDTTESDSLSCDEFRMYEFKVRRCIRGRSHDWTDCPFAHPGEKARRRDPRHHRYSGTACPDFRKGGSCKKGESCEFAHGVFECWLHPTRYRTQPCKDGAFCKRRVCFFAHSADQIRVLPAVDKPPETFDFVGAMRGLRVGKSTGTLALSSFDTWDPSLEEETGMERVESGRSIRARMYTNLRVENPLPRPEPAGPVPDIRWISELVE